MTKKEVEILFKEEFKDFLIEFKTDRPAYRQAWNDYVDSLRKNGDIRPNSDWMQPKFISKD